jgi:hypothetical protein
MRTDALLRRAASAARAVASLEPMDLALRLTALDLLLRPVGGPRLRPAFVGLAALVLLVPPWLRARAAWAALAALAAVRLVADWPLADNHAYLLAYWCLAVTLALGGPAPGEALARSARLLVGLAFAFAVLWKAVLSPDFLDGTFLRVTLLADPRLDALAPATTGLSPEALQPWRDWIAGHGSVSAAPGPLPPRLQLVVAVATAWTLALEGAVAASFLAPAKMHLGRVRDVLLLVFCVTTYAVLPVKGFGWLLLAMGAAQSPPERRGVRASYLAAFAWVALCSALRGEPR